VTEIHSLIDSLGKQVIWEIVNLEISVMKQRQTIINVSSIGFNSVFLKFLEKP
jgi:hypothetical protein